MTRIPGRSLVAGAIALVLLDPRLAVAAEAVTGEVQRQPLNVAAIVMFLIFVAVHARHHLLGGASAPSRPPTSTPPAAASPASRTASRSPATTCRRHRSSASPAWSSPRGYDGLIYSIGLLVGWPIILFLIAERLRNLGKYTFADVASYRLAADPDPHRSRPRHADRRGLLPDRADGRRGQADPAAVRPALPLAVIIVGVLMIIYVTFGGMLATTWVQIIKAVPAARRRDLHGARRALALRLQPGGAVRRGGRESIPRAQAIMAPGRPGQRSDLGDLARPGADVRHRRPAAHPDALLHRARCQGRRASRCSTPPASSATSTS